MAFNIFSKRKKPLNQSLNQSSSSAQVQGSGYGSNYASNASNYKAPQQPAVKASTYSTPNYLSSLTKQPTIQTRQQPQQTQQSTTRPAPTPYKAPQTLPWGTNTGILPWGQKQPQTATPRVQGQQSTPRPQGGMSVAPKPVNMSVDPNAGRYQAPVPKPEVQPQAQPQADPSQDWMNYISNAGQNRVGTENTRLQEQLKFLQEQGQLNNQQLLEQLPVNQENFDQYKGNTEASIADLIAGGERQKDQTSDYYGDAQRQAALSRRDVQGQTQKTFAGLGTLDSRGEGSFAQETANQDSEFNRFTQQNLKAKADQLSEIDETVRTAERNARATITQEEQKMNQLARDIQYSVANNDLTTAQGLKEAYSQSQQYVFDIEDSLAQTKYQFGLQQQALENELELRNAPGGALSIEGESKLRSEFFNRTKDNKYNEVAQSYDKILNANDSAAGDIGMVFSYMKLLDPTSTVREGEFATAQNAAGIPTQVLNVYNKAMTGERLAPSQREDFKKSALVYVTPVINQQKEAEKYYSQLAIQQGLNPNNVVGGYGDTGLQANTGTSQGGQVTMQSPDGQTYTVDQSEVQEAVGQGWRQI